MKTQSQKEAEMRFNTPKEFFLHCTDMRDEPKMKAVRGKFGAEGYGVWCMLLEAMLRGVPNVGIRYNDYSEREILAGDFGIDSECLEAMVLYFEKIGLIVDKQGWLTSGELRREVI